MVEGVFARVFRVGPAPGRARPPPGAGDGRQPLGRRAGPHRSCPTTSPSSSAEADHEQFAEIARRARPRAGRRRPRARPRRGLRVHGPGRGRARRRRAARRTGRVRRSSARMREGKGGVGRRLARAARPATASRSARRSSPSAACPSPTIVLADPNVSRSHAEIRPHGDGFVVVDLGSTNGTRVNGVPVTEQRAARRRRAHLRQHPLALRGLLTATALPRGADPVGSPTCPSSCSPSSSSACSALLYLFFLRVLRAVWAEITPARSVEVAAPRQRGAAAKAPARQAGQAGDGRRPRPAGRRRAGRPARAAPTRSADELTVGRAAGCQVTLDDTYASQLHARVFQPRRPAVRRGPRLHQRHLPQPQEGRRARWSCSRGDQLQVGNTVLELRVTVDSALRARPPTSAGSAADNEDSILVADAPLRGGRRHGRPPGRRGRVGHRRRGRSQAHGHRAHRRRRSSRRSQLANARSSTQAGRRPRARAAWAPRCAPSRVVDGDDGDDERRRASTSATRASTCCRDGDLDPAHRGPQPGRGPRARAASSPTTRPRSTRSATSSPGPSASTPTSTVDVVRRSIPFTGDRFLLCSDGLFNEVDDDQIAAVLRRLADPTRRPTSWCAWPTSAAAATTSPWSSSTWSTTAAGAGRRRSPADAGPADASRPPTAAPVRRRRAGRRRPGDARRPRPTPAAADAGDDDAADRRRRRPAESDDRAPATSTAAGPSTSPGGSRLFVRRPAGRRRRRRRRHRLVRPQHLLRRLRRRRRSSIYQGQPGGVLWFEPTRRAGTEHQAADVPDECRDASTSGKEQRRSTPPHALRAATATTIDQPSQPRPPPRRRPRPRRPPTTVPAPTTTATAAPPTPPSTRPRRRPADGRPMLGRVRRNTELGPDPARSSSSPAAPTRWPASAGRRRSRPTSARSSASCSACCSSPTSPSAASRPSADGMLLPLAGCSTASATCSSPASTAEAGRPAGDVDRASASSRFVATLLVVRRVRDLERYRYTFAARRHRPAAAAARARPRRARSTAPGSGCGSGRSASSPASSPRSPWPSSSPPTWSRSASCWPWPRWPIGPLDAARPQAPRPGAAGVGRRRSW